MTLRTVGVGNTAVIDSVQMPRLLSMGFVPGAKVLVLREKKGCLHVRIGRTEWAIRASTADFVKIKEA